VHLIREALKILGAVALVAPIDPAHGTSTICSNPRRAGVRVAATVPLPWSKVEELSHWLETSSKKTLGMSFARVDSGDEGKPMTEKTIILQSPKVSVNIHITAVSGSARAKVAVNRTCYYDALEPWRPFWTRFRLAMKDRGYTINP
jgi:hypothetical protein